MPDTSQLFELHKQHAAAWDKYTYFLLAGAASGIAFALTKTEGQKLSRWLTPAALSVISWGASFFGGCRAVQWNQGFAMSNYIVLSLRLGVHPKQPASLEELAIALQAGERSMEDKNKKIEFWAKMQFRLLVTGAVLFVLWRVVEMVRISYA